MAETRVSQLAVFGNEKDIQYVEKEGDIFFTAEVIGRHLGYSNPANAVHKLFHKHYSELNMFAVSAKLASSEGFQRDTRLFTEEGVYILSMLARTKAARKFRERVARLLRRVRHEALARQIELARASADARLDDMERALEYARRRLVIAEKTNLLAGVTAARAIMDLPRYVRDRLPAVTRYAQRGFTTREIAKVTGVARRTVRQTLEAARWLGLVAVQGAQAALASGEREAVKVSVQEARHEIR